MDSSARKKIVLLLFSCQFFLSRAVKVSTSNGQIIGSENLKSRNGRVIHSFSGIPYAQPPVGELRFKEARPAKPWTEPLDATSYGPECPQPNFRHLFDENLQASLTLGQEDCLNLNVYSPKVDSAAKLPVMVWIHGGGFFIGSNLPGTNGPEYLLDQDVVLVTINYRLGVLGFLMTGDDKIPGNLGLKDQVLALKWVHDNIEGFGGDPNLVTVAGVSAGGASAHLNLLSPLTKGLIHRGIAMSGTGFCPWAVSPTWLAIDRTKALAVMSGCPSEPSEKLLKCMQTIPTEILLRMGGKFPEYTILPVVVFGPAIEPEDAKNAFLPTDLRHLKSQVPLLTGIDAQEGSSFATVLFMNGNRFEIDLKNYKQHVLPELFMLKSKFSRDLFQTVSDRIVNFYFGKKPIDKNATEELTDMLSDSWFVDGAIEAVSRHSGDAYLYFHEYRQSDVSYCNYIGEMAKDNKKEPDRLKYKMKCLQNACSTTSKERMMKQLHTSATDWPNQNGDLPDTCHRLESVHHIENKGFDLQKRKPTESTWSKWVAGANSNKYLHITEEPSIKENLLPERLGFWKSLNELQDNYLNADPKRYHPEL